MNGYAILSFVLFVLLIYVIYVMNQQIIKQKQQIDDLNKNLKQKDEEITQKKNEITQKNNIITQKDEEITQKNNQITQKDDIIRSLIILLSISSIASDVYDKQISDVNLVNKFRELSRKFADEMISKYFSNGKFKYETDVRQIENIIRKELNIPPSTINIQIR